MGDPRVIGLYRVVAATLVARIVGVSFLILLLIFLLFWPILVERHLDVRPGNLATACDYMVAQIRQQSKSSVGFTPVAQPECWRAQANTGSAP
jgi:hypothetical protein